MLQTGFRAMMGVKIFGSDPARDRAGRPADRADPQAGARRDRRRRRPHRRQAVPGVRDRPRRRSPATASTSATCRTSSRSRIGGENLTDSVEGRERYPIRVRYLRELREDVSTTWSGSSCPPRPAPRSRSRRWPRSRAARPAGAQERERPARRLRDAEHPRPRRGERRRGRRSAAPAERRSDDWPRGKACPPGYYWKWSGQFENQQRATERHADPRARLCSRSCS